MTPEDARKAICIRWAAQWGATTPFVFENEDNKNLDAGTAPWARFTVRNVEGGQETLGPDGHRNYVRKGLVLVQIFTPKDGGMKRGDELAHQARAIFEGASFDGIDFNNGRVREVVPDGKWQPFVAEADFIYYETK